MQRKPEPKAAVPKPALSKPLQAAKAAKAAKARAPRPKPPPSVSAKGKLAGPDAPNQSEAVDGYFATLEHPKKEVLAAVRAALMKASPKLKERLKWNAPSFFYKADLAAFHMRAADVAHLVLIFPKGIIESPGLLEGEYADRRMAYFSDLADLKRKTPALQQVVREWVARMDA